LSISSIYRDNSEKNIFIYTMDAIFAQLYLLERLQCKNDLYYTDGLYAAARVWANNSYHRKDNTCFFTACIGLTLIRYRKLFKAEELEIVDGILERMHAAFENFRNKDGHASYNFWQTMPSKHFPGGYFAHRFNFFMIPDDIDDSAMIHLVKRHTKEEQLALKEKMIKYAVGNLKWPDKPVRGYEKFKPYNTFFVKNMPAAFDVCALSNALYFIYDAQLTLNEQDEHSLAIITKCIAQNDHLNRPYEVSPYYPNSILIIYHVVRLMIDFSVECLFRYREKILNQSKQLLLNATQNKMEQLLLTICIQKIEPQTIHIDEPNMKEKKHFSFFVAGLLGEVRPKWLRSLAFSNVTHIKYQSGAYAEALWLEHLLLNSAAKKLILDN